MSIGERLREERERLGLNQDTFAAFGNVSKRALYTWEQGVATPNADYLAHVAPLGVDVRYVVTGSRDYVPPAALTPDERELLDLWRAASSEVRRAARGALVGAAPSRTVFNGPVGQRNEGVTGGTFSVDMSGMKVTQRHPKGGGKKK